MRRRREKPEDVAQTYVKAQKDRTGFCVKDVPPKGRGVFADANFVKGDFLLQYCGKLCTWEEGDKLEEELSSGFRFFFKYKGQGFCIDATEEPVTGPSFGRLVNHADKEVNVKLNIVDVEGNPSLCLFALCDINHGEELLYNYGVKNLPWKEKDSKKSCGVEATIQKPSQDSKKSCGVEATIQKPSQDSKKSCGVEATIQKPSQDSKKSCGVEATIQKPSQDSKKSCGVEATIQKPSQDSKKSCGVEATIQKPSQDSKKSCGVEATIQKPSQDSKKSCGVEATIQKPSQNPQRWAHQVEQLLNGDAAVRVKTVGRLSFSRQFKIADGSNGTQIFIGLVDNLFPVAVKRLNQGMESMEGEVHEILCDGKVEARYLLKHILMEQDDDFVYFASPLCEYNLEEVIEQKSNPLRAELTSSKRATMCHQLMLGLSELHRANILHRDLKPRNVLLDHSCKVLLGDFGISRQITTGTTLVTKAMGTLCWTSPENGSDNCRYKKSSDIQMLGCLIYYILSDGHVPHETTVPYTKQPEGVVTNMKKGQYSLGHLGVHGSFQPLLEMMLNPCEDMRPTIEDCIAFYEETVVIPDNGTIICDADNINTTDPLLEHVDVNTLKAFSFVASSISKSKKAKIQKLAELHGCTFTEEIQCSTTHIIISTEEDLCPRTMKFMAGIAAGLWIVSYTWVESSLDAGMLLPETDYEVKGDEGWGPHSGAFRARTQKASKPLLSGYSISLCGKSSVISEDEVTKLLKLCGANTPEAVKSVMLLMDDVILGYKEVSDGEEKTMRHNSDGRPVVLLTWLLDTVSTYEIQPFEKYLYSHLNSLSAGDGGSRSSHIVPAAAVSDDDDLDGCTDDDGDDDYTPENDPDNSSNVGDDSNRQDSNSDTEDELTEDDGYDTAGDGGSRSSHIVPAAAVSDDDDLDGCTDDDGDDDYTPENDPDNSSNVGDDSNRQDSNSDTEDELTEEGGSDSVESRKTVPLENSGNKSSAAPFVVDCVGNKYCYCPFCDKLQQKLPRHCKKKHSDEVLVAKVSSVSPQKHQLIRQEWLQLRNMGNHKHNTLVYQGEADDLVVRKRPTDAQSERYSVYSYVPCGDCLGYYHKNSLWIHKKTCKVRENISHPSHSSNHVKEGRKLIPLRSKVSRELNDCVHSMAMDKLSLTIRNDKDILQVGQNTLSVSNSSRKKDKAREKMRIIAKLLHHAREQDKKIETARDLVHPSSFNVVVQCAKRLSGFNEDKQIHTSYSSVLRVGYALADLASVVKNDYIKLQMRDKVAEVDDFIYLRQTEWRSCVSAAAHRQSQENKWKSPKLLPLTEDCVSFNNFLKGEEMKLKNVALKGFPSTEVYKKFASVTLAQVIFFNRRRPKEVEQLTVKDYLDQLANKSPVHDEILQSLTTPEKISLNRLTMLMVRGKRGRGVPILLTENLKQSLDMLAEHNKEREYLFSRITEGSSTPLRGYEVMAELADVAVPSLKQPANIRCTKLRKHLATLSQLLNLNDNELEQLANHMGHDVNTHRDYYRLPMETLILAKVSKMLTLSQHGRVHEYQGKSLEDIVIHPDEQLAPSCVNECDDNEEDDDALDEVNDGNDHSEDNQKEEIAGNNPTTSEPAVEAQESVQAEKVSRRKIFKYTKWSKAEENFLFRQKEIKSLLATRRVPRKLQCLLVIQRSKGLLKGKTWQDVKNKIHNTNKAAKLKLQKKSN